MDRSRIEPDHTFLYKPLAGVQAGGCHLDVWLPEEDSIARDGSPVAMMFHGGGFAAGTRSGIPYNQVRYLLHKGVTVVSSSYRFIPHVKAKEIRTDLVDAYRFVHDKLESALHEAGASLGLKLDSTRCFVMGWSAGGISSLWLASDVTRLSKTERINPPRAVIAAYAIADFNSLFNAPLPARDPEFDQNLASLLKEPCATDIPIPGGTASDNERYSKQLDERRVTQLMGFMGKILPTGSLCTAIVGYPAPFHADESTINGLSEDFPPTYIFIAEADELIPTSHSRDLYNRLQSLGVKSQIGIARDMKHGEVEALEGVFTWRDDVGWWDEAVVPSLEFALAQL